MEKMLECIFAYICKTNYSGACIPQDQIYTLTKGMTEADIKVVSEIIQNVGRVELAKIDVQNGVSLDCERVEPNFDMSSYTYLPAKNGGYSAFSCASLRKSLRNKNIRGSKELSHVIAFNEVKKDFYVVDLLKSKYFEPFKDIRLDDSAFVASSNEDLVCEIRPAELEEISWDNFESKELSCNDIVASKKITLKAISEFVHAVIISFKEQKTLYVVYNPEDFDDMEEYLRLALKLFPSNVANEISFITALGKTSRVNVNICGVPTSDEEYIASLRREGNVIRLTGWGIDCLGGEKGSFASFLEKASDADFEDWLESSNRYKNFIRSVADIDVVATLYTNITGKEFDADNPRQSLIAISSCIKFVTEKFNMISAIENELESQIDGIGTQIKYACGAFAEYSAYEIEKFLIEPIIALYDKCAAKSEKESQKVLMWLRRVLFGMPGQTELEEKHYEVLSGSYQKVKQLLGNRYVRLIELIESEWGSLKPFFDNYLNEPRYAESSAGITVSYLEYFLKDFSNTKRSRMIVRDYFVTQFLQKNPDRFRDIVRIIFSADDDRLQEKLSYIFDGVIQVDSPESGLLKSRIEYFCAYIEENNLLNKVLEYVRDRYTKQFGGDVVFPAVFKGLLLLYLQVPKAPALADLYNSYINAQKLIGENSGISLKRFVFQHYADSVLVPYYEEALKAVRFEDMNDALEQRYRNFAAQLKSSSIKDLIPDKVVAAIEDVLDRYKVFDAQIRRENELLKDRIDFVARELLLLENKTIYRILEKYLGTDQLLSDLQVFKIEGKPYKNPNFLQFAEKEVLGYLNDKEVKNKADFCEDVRTERKRNYKDYRIGTFDVISNLIGSVIFAVIMGVLTALLGGVIYNYVADKYFRSIYVIFTVIIFAFSMIIYWTNYKDRRLRNVVLMSTWQALLVIVGTLGIFTLTQYLMVLLKL